MPTLPPNQPAPAAASATSTSFLQRSAWRRTWLAAALLAGLWLVLLASLSATD